MNDERRLPWRFWRGLAWAWAAGVIAAVVVYFATGTALDLAKPLWSRPLSVGGGGHQFLLRTTVLFGILAAPVVVAVMSGLRLRWWYTGVACQSAGVVCAAIALGLAPNEIGVGMALVTATSWVAGSTVGTAACGIRRWGAAR